MPRLLNLGSGPRGILDEHWINVDGYADRGVHGLLDFTRRLPFDDNTFDGAFCEHVLEHFRANEGERVLAEVQRVLKPRGVLRVIVPDGAWVVRSYLEDPGGLCAHRDETGQCTAMEIVNLYFRQRYEHQFLYDWETLERTLERSGFSTAVRGGYRTPGLMPEIVIDDPKYAPESLYAEAQKAP